MEDTSKVNAGDHLASSGIHGIAPFFANIDIRKGGHIFLEETDGKFTYQRAYTYFFFTLCPSFQLSTVYFFRNDEIVEVNLSKALLADPEVLSRATMTISKSINDKKFQATTAVVVTYVNVTDADQTVLLDILLKINIFR